MGYGIATGLALAGIGSAVGLGKQFIYDPIQRQHFPDTTLLKNEVLSLEPNAQGGYDITPDLFYRYGRSDLDDIVKQRYGSTDMLEKYIADEQRARRTREVQEKIENRDLDPDYRADRAHLAATRASELEGIKHNRAELTSARLFREAQLRHQQEQAALKASYRNDDLIRQNRLDLRALENNALELTNNQALALAELQEKKNRSAWERGIYEDQLERDEQQRIRDQRKFYALLGQSVLSEGLKAFF